MTAARWLQALIIFALLARAPLGAARAADAMSDLNVRTTKTAFADVLTDVEAAIVNQGFVIDLKGNIGGMLDRTAKDVGSSKAIYKQAQYFSFCSARLSRAMLEADPANMGFCPFVVFVYERADEPGKVTVGYRRPPAGTGAAAPAFAAIDKMLNGIIEESTK